MRNKALLFISATLLSVFTLTAFTQENIYNTNNQIKPHKRVRGNLLIRQLLLYMGAATICISHILLFLCTDLLEVPKHGTLLLLMPRSRVGRMGKPGILPQYVRSHLLRQYRQYHQAE